MEKPQLQTIYDVIGPDTIEKIVHAFYPKVYADPELIPIFDIVEMEEVMYKQRLFLTQFIGGPALFSQQAGPPMMKRRHLEHEITETRAHAWLRCMKEAFQEIGLWDKPIGRLFYSKLEQVAAIMINTDETSANID